MRRIIVTPTGDVEASSLCIEVSSLASSQRRAGVEPLRRGVEARAQTPTWALTRWLSHVPGSPEGGLYGPASIDFRFVSELPLQRAHSAFFDPMGIGVALSRAARWLLECAWYFLL